MIWIRADANRKIGSGHIMRCLSIAAELENMGAQTCFLVADESAVPLFQERGQRYKVLHTDYTILEKELGRIESLFQGQNRDFFLVDSYFVTSRYLSHVKKYMPVGYMDDICQIDFPVDLLINYNIFADSVFYRQLRGTRLLLGTKYAPLRKEFTEVDYEIREKASRVLITTGGSDKYNLAGRLMAKAITDRRTAGLEYCVVSGVYNIHLDELKGMEEEHSNVHIYSNVYNMAELMQQCDIAVTAGGSTMYELSAVGVPIICFSFVENQERIVEGFHKAGLVCFGGNYLTQGEDMLDKLIDTIALLSGSAALRREYSKKVRNVVDGCGALRIAQKITQTLSDV